MQFIAILFFSLLPILLGLIYKYKLYQPQSLAGYKNAPPFTPAHILIGYGLYLFSPVFAQAILLSLPRFAPMLNLKKPELPQPTASDTALFYLLCGISQLLAVVYIIYKARSNNAQRWPLGLSPHKPLRLLKCAAMTTLTAFVFTTTTGLLLTQILTYFTNTPNNPIAHKSLVTIIQAKENTTLYYTLISTIILAPVLEEFLFRGLIQNTLKKQLPQNPFYAILITSVIFSLIHIGTAPDPKQLLVSIPILFILSCIMGYSYFKSNSLYVPILTHMAFNGINILQAVYLVS